jgi:N-acetylglucosaminyldiphosphoundecaprenol N-acetyl-beta-D-mannosaminyltransferase
MPKILKVRIDKCSLEKAVELSCKTKQQIHICTVNPEIILEAQKNTKFLKILNRSALNTADGIGVLWASKFIKTSQGKSKPVTIAKWMFSLLSILIWPSYIKTEISNRVTGVELTKEICKTTKKRIFLLGGSEKVVSKTKTSLNANIVGTSSNSGDKNMDKENIKLINDSKAEILFVAFGAPKQELWINRNLRNLKTVHTAIGVGGTFDFISGEITRAPEWMQRTGTEWIYRLLKQPKRIKRIFNATIKFPLTVLGYSLKNR